MAASSIGIGGIRKLMSLGVSPDNAIKHGLSSLNYWRMARSPVVQQALSNEWLKSQGLVSVKDLWCKAQGCT
jgi:RNA-directed DNA polymerase